MFVSDGLKVGHLIISTSEKFEEVRFLSVYITIVINIIVLLGIRGEWILSRQLVVLVTEK